jgi:hypothetical protein
MSNKPLTKTEWLASLEKLWETAQQPRQWVGLTDDDWVEIGSRKNTVLDTFACGAAWAADQLKERNT